MELTTRAHARQEVPDVDRHSAVDGERSHPLVAGGEQGEIGWPGLPTREGGGGLGWPGGGQGEDTAVPVRPHPGR